jgi:hypothetical protein
MPGFGPGANAPFSWDDGKIARVLTYIRGEWGNTGAPIDPGTVARIRQETGDREPWTQDELLRIHR